MVLLTKPILIVTISRKLALSLNLPVLQLKELTNGCLKDKIEMAIGVTHQVFVTITVVVGDFW